MKQGEDRGSFTSKQAQSITGLPLTTLDYWSRTGFVEPSISDSPGTGRSRLYSFMDLVALKVAKGLKESGISVQGIRKVVAFLQKEGVEDPTLARVALVSDGQDVMLRTGEQLQSLLGNPGQFVFCFIIDLSSTRDEVRREVELLAA